MIAADAMEIISAGSLHRALPDKPAFAAARRSSVGINRATRFLSHGFADEKRERASYSVTFIAAVRRLLHPGAALVGMTSF